MRKSGIFILGTLLSFGFLFAKIDTATAKASEKMVCIGGQAAGFTLIHNDQQLSKKLWQLRKKLLQKLWACPSKSAAST